MSHCPSKRVCAPYGLLGLLFVFQILLSFDSTALAWDGAFYYAATRSIVFDGDLRLANDLRLSYAVTPAQDFARQGFDERLTPTGRVDSPFSIGVSLLWLPWFALIAGLMRLASLAGLAPASLTGYEPPFLWGIAAVTCVYGWVGMLASLRLVRQFVGRWAVLIAGFTAMLTTPLVYYQFREPFYAHAASAMVVALFVCAWWRAAGSPLTARRAFGLGLLGGLAGLVRTQDITYLALPLLSAVGALYSALRLNQRRAAWQALLSILLLLLGSVLALTPQLCVWQITYGRPLLVPQGGAFMDWRAPWILPTLLSTFHGLLPWMPLVAPAALGLFCLARRFPRRALALGAAFLLQVYVNGCVRQWFGGGGYGARRFSSLLIILVIGYASLLDWRKERWYRGACLALSGVLILHQWLILRYGFGAHIGGYAVETASAAWEYEWRADPVLHFVRQLLGYIPQALENPWQALVFPGAPLETVWRSPVAAFLQALPFPFILGALYAAARGARWLQRRFPCLLIAGCVVLILCADGWLLRWA